MKQTLTIKQQSLLQNILDYKLPMYRVTYDNSSADVAKENPVEDPVGFHSVVSDVNSAVCYEDIERPGSGFTLLCFAFHFSDLQHTNLICA